MLQYIYSDDLFPLQTSLVITEQQSLINAALKQLRLAEPTGRGGLQETVIMVTPTLKSLVHCYNLQNHNPK